MIGARGTGSRRARRAVSSTVRRVAPADSHSVRRRTGSVESGKQISAPITNGATQISVETE